MGFGIVIPLLPLYAVKHDPTPVQFGLLMASYSAMQFLFAPVLGWLSDRYGRRPVLLLSLLGSAFGYILFAFAHTLLGLFVSRIAAGIMGGNIGAAQAVIADTTQGPERARGMGLVGMAFGLGFIFGPAIGGFAVHLGEAAPGLVATGLSLAAFAWAYFRLPETRKEGSAVRELRVFSPASVARVFSRPVAGPLLFCALLTTSAFSALEATFSQFLHSKYLFTSTAVAWSFVIVGLTSAAVQGGLLRRVVPRFGEAPLIAGGALLVVAGFTTLLFVPPRLILFPAIVVLSAGTGLLNPCLMGLVSRATDPSEQGETLGVFQSMGSLGRIVGPFVGENLFLRQGPASTYGGAATLYSIVFLIVAFGLLRTKPSGGA